MSDFFNAPTDSKVSLKDVSKQIDPILYKTPKEPEVYFLLDEPPDDFILKDLISAIKVELDKPFGIISVVPFTPKGAENDRAVLDFYTTKAISIETYIPKGKPIVSFGRSLYTITESSTLEIEGFYDIVFNKSYFYSPQTESFIYPVDSLWKWLRPKKGILDNWERYFFYHQVKQINRGLPRKPKQTEYDIQIVKNPNQFLKDYTNYEGLMAWDTETKGLDEWSDEGRILCMSLTFDGYTGYVLPWNRIDRDVLSEFFKNKKGILHNSKYDCRWMIIKEKVPIENIYIHADTWNGSHNINEMQSSRLKTDAYLYTTLGGYDNELDRYKKRYPECRDDYSKIPKPLLYKYAGLDAIVTWHIFEAQQNLMKTKYKRLYDYYWNETMPLVREFLHIEVNGMAVDRDALREFSEEIKVEIEKAKIAIFKEMGIAYDSISLSSTIELGVALEMLGLPCHGRSKSKPSKEAIRKVKEALGNKVKKEVSPRQGVYLTGDDPLTFWKRDGYDIAKLIFEYKKVDTMKKTFSGDEIEGGGYWDAIKSDGRLHPNFGVMLTKSHRNWCREPNLQQCFSRDTEILTKKGWIRFDRLPQDFTIEVAQYDETTKTIDFVIPTDYIQHPEKELLHITTDKQIDLLVTKDHECLIQNRRSKAFKKVEAINYPLDARQIQAGIFSEKKDNPLFSDEELRFICALQADGTVTLNERQRTPSFDFFFSKDRKVERFRGILNKLNLAYKESNKKNRQGVRFYIPSSEFTQKISNYKYFGEWILTLSYRQLKVMSEEIYLWDGLSTRKSEYSSSIESNTDWAQVIFILTGTRANKRQSESDKIINHFRVNTAQKDYSLTTNHKKELVPYNDDVFCVRVPTENIIVRRKGKVAITGNCPKHGKWAKKIRKIFNPGPDFVIDEKDGAGFQLRIGAALSGDQMMFKVFTELSGDMHSMTAQQIFMKETPIEEFLQYIKDEVEPYCKHRKKAKGANFSLEFGSSAFSFAKSTLEMEWTLQEAKDFCKDNDLTKMVDGLYSKGLSNGMVDNRNFCYYWASAIHIRKGFFTTYPGLERMIKYQSAFAEKNGYVESAFGAIRRLPQLLYIGKDDRQSHIKNLKNIAVNSPVQNFEIVKIGRMLVKTGNYCRVNGLKSFAVTQVHDSGVFQTHKDEISIVKRVSEEAFGEDTPENNGIPMLLDSNIANYEEDEVWGYGKKYDHGQEIK